MTAGAAMALFAVLCPVSGLTLGVVIRLVLRKPVLPWRE